MQPCSLCNSIEVTEIPESKDVRHWKCATCGEIIVSGSLLPSLPKRFEILWLLSAYSRKRSKSGLPPADLHTGNIDAIIEQMHKLKPNSIVESQNRVINYFAERSDLLGSWIEYDENSNLDVILKKTEMRYIIKSLGERNLVEIEGGIQPVVVGASDDPAGDYTFEFGTGRMRLTLEGWEKNEDMQLNRLQSTQGFVAMNFDSKCLEIYIEAIEPAIREAGFDPYRIDQDRHIENINNRILSKIKESRFLVAEFTGHKHGVYFETGFALGLGMPVIWLCEESEFGKVHFDTKPFNHIVWPDKQKLKEELFWFIKANI